jgi:1-acyl-sn-glycerol-3-phosphate acyltransferase
MEVQGFEHIPSDGPLLVVANHPGMMDGLVITANLPRPDLKIIASAMPIFTELQAMKEHLIYTTRNTFERLAVVRQAIQHLREDGAVLIFPRGIIEPDPAILPPRHHRA